MKYLSEAKICIELEISRDQSCGLPFASQTHYINFILERFSLDSTKPVPTPIEEKREFLFDQILDEQTEFCDGNVSYHESIESLMYLKIGTQKILRTQL